MTGFNDHKSAEPHRVLNRIGGDLLPASNGEEFERRDPADTRRVVSIAPESTTDDVRAAVDAATEASAQWRRTTPSRRAELLTGAARLLTERGESIAAEMVAEEGKPLADAKNEAGRTPRNLELYAGEAYRLNGATFPSDDTPLVYSVCDPIGVVGVITPWNFPLNMASRKIGPALAAGNTVVFKPSPMTPLMGDRLAAAFIDAGLPPGVLNVVHGFSAGADLVTDTRVGAITFTGSNATGSKIHAAVGLGRRVQLELGGKNPVIVLADADLAAAASIVARSSFSLSGQACTGAGRILADASIYDELLERVVALAEAYAIGPGDQPATTMGPLVDSHAVVAMEAAVAQAVADGATVARINGLDEANASANAVPYGLSAALCTRDLRSAQHFAAEIQAGMVRINRATVGAAFNAPFGGIKQSGTATHKEQLGPTVMDFYTVMRTIWMGN